MNEPGTVEQFNQALEQARQGKSKQDDALLSPELQADVHLARAVSQVDFSQESRSRATLRARLMERARRELPARGRTRRAASSVRRVLSAAGIILLVIALLFTLDWALRSARPRPSNSLPANQVGSPLPTETSTIPPTSTLSPTATTTPKGSPAPTPLRFGLSSTHAELRQGILQPVWDTLWVEGEIHGFSADGTAQVTYVQAWLARDGRGRVLTSQPLPEGIGFNLDVAPARISISNGSEVTDYAVATRQTTTFAEGAMYPLENANRLTQMLFPSFLAIRSADVAPLREETLAGRPALVLDWGGDRLWVDEATGLLLRQEHPQVTGEAVSSGYQVQVRQLVLGVGLPDAVIHPPYLNELAFEVAPTPAPSDGQVNDQQLAILASIGSDQAEVSVRSGPNAISPKVGTLQAGDQVRVLGKLADRSWLEIVYPPGSNGKAWVYASLMSVSGSEIPVVAPDGSPVAVSTPDAALTTPVDPVIAETIRRFGQQKGSEIIYMGKTDFMAMGPALAKTVDRYQVDGVDYDIDPLTHRVVDYTITPIAISGGNTYSADELKAIAQSFVASQIPGIQLQKLSFEQGQKGENTFFRWSQAATGPGYMVCVQVGYTAGGQLFNYIDSLPADLSSTAGQVYLQAAGQPPYLWQMLALPADCLASLAACPEPDMLPGAPNVETLELAWSPDHSLAAFSDTNHNQLVVFNRASGQWQRVLSGFFQAHLAWSADGQAIAAVGAGSDAYNDSLVIIQRDGWSARTIDTPLKGQKTIAGWIDSQTLAVITFISPFKGPAPAWASENPQPGLYQVDIASGKVTLIVDGNGLGGAAVSPDGKQLAFSRIIDGEWNMSVANIDGTGAHPVSSASQHLAWSPDGQWIASYRLASSGDVLILVHPDGSGLQEIQLNHFLNGPLIWKPDGKALLVELGDPINPNKQFGLYQVTLENSALRQVNLPYLQGVTHWQMLGWQP